MKVLADTTISNLTYPGQKITTNFNLSDLLTKGGFNLVTFVFFLAGLVFFFNLLLAAWEYVMSTGDAKKIQSATSRLLNAFVGVVIVLASFIIVRIVLAVLGLQALFT